MSDTIPALPPGVDTSMRRVRQLLGKEPVPVDPARDALTKALADVQAMLVAEDLHMRTKVLPEAPEGYYWLSWIETARQPEGVLGRVHAHLCYRLEPNP